jgi:hypothetical protein
VSYVLLEPEGKLVPNLSHAESPAIATGRDFKHRKSADLGNAANPFEENAVLSLRVMILHWWSPAAFRPELLLSAATTILFLDTPKTTMVPDFVFTVFNAKLSTVVNSSAKA